MERGAQVKGRAAHAGLVVVLVLVLAGLAIACGGARKPCSAPVRSLDGAAPAASASATAGDADEATPAADPG